MTSTVEGALPLVCTAPALAGSRSQGPGAIDRPAKGCPPQEAGACPQMVCAASQASRCRGPDGGSGAASSPAPSVTRKEAPWNTEPASRFGVPRGFPMPAQGRARLGADASAQELGVRGIGDGQSRGFQACAQLLHEAVGKSTAGGRRAPPLKPESHSWYFHWVRLMELVPGVEVDETAILAARAGWTSQ